MRLTLLTGTVSGTADMVADAAESRLIEAGVQTTRLSGANVEEFLASAPEAILVVTATTGMGEVPDDLLPLQLELNDRFPLLTGIPFGVIGLGDSSYDDTFCQGGRDMRELLLELQAREALPMLELDASETVNQDEDAEPWVAEFLKALGR
ncbi:flavodoxin domain-containing protein [Halopseudomonas salegens]|uniref:MioC protein n=1 Tax=Halopseudomonas salegens TaxID=1434072 RepID=A0A1H2E9Z7_9GAMM|nr:flavodoxin domain-containing protein [Halopseudomonas salegens]SDT91971.1 MioC protein [Halopseudomonas salegens]